MNCSAKKSERNARTGGGEEAPRGQVSFTCAVGGKWKVFLSRMPGVSVEPSAVDCAESGLESVIGSLLSPLEPDEEGVSQEEEEEEVAQEVEQRMQEVVGEARAELRDFGHQLEQRLQQRLLGPLLQSLQELQQDNLRLRLQQERLARQVDTLCQALQLPEFPPLVLPGSQQAAVQLPDLSHILSDGLILDMNNDLTSYLGSGMTFDSIDGPMSDMQPKMPTVPSEEVSPEMKPYLFPDAMDGLTFDPCHGASALDAVSFDSFTSGPENGVTSEAVAMVTPDLTDGMTPDTEVEVKPHPPAFSTRRSSSTTSMPTTVSRSNSMV